MFCSKRMKKLISHQHKKILKLRYQLKGKTLFELLSIDDSHVIHVRNIQVLMTEIYKTIHNLNPKFMKEIFQVKKCDIRNNNLIIIPKTYTQSFGQKSISFRGAVLWNNLSLDIKEANNLESFKHLIKLCK